MECKQTRSRSWRKEMKKLQRKRKRQKAAKERDKLLSQDEERKLADPVYQKELQRQADLAELEAGAAQRINNLQEEAWMRRELLAQRQFRLDRQKRDAEQAVQEAVRQQQHKELEEREAAQRRRLEERRRLEDAAAAEFDRTMQAMEGYLAHPSMEVPEALRSFIDTRPGQKLCEMFVRTNSCRFGVSCVFNHRRPLLSCIVLVRNFFAHPLLEQREHHEYAGADAALELSERDLRDDYDEFFEDVVPELEDFGKILNFRCARNVQAYIRGHVFVEYADERSALKAFIKIQGRYYASKRLSVEFSNVTTWRGAICGLSLKRMCPKGQHCNYLHLFRNPANKYNTPVENMTPRKTPSVCETTMPIQSWNEVDAGNTRNEARNWRWSQSPEIELKSADGDASPHSSEKRKAESCDKRRSISRSRDKHKRRDRSRDKHKRKDRSRDKRKKSSRRRSDSKSKSKSH